MDKGTKSKSRSRSRSPSRTRTSPKPKSGKEEKSLSPKRKSPKRLSPNRNAGLFETLPSDMIGIIMSNLNPKDQSSLKMTGKTMKNIIGNVKNIDTSKVQYNKGVLKFKSNNSPLEFIFSIYSLDDQILSEFLENFGKRDSSFEIKINTKGSKILIRPNSETYIEDWSVKGSKKAFRVTLSKDLKSVKTGEDLYFTIKYVKKTNKIQIEVRYLQNNKIDTIYKFEMEPYQWIDALKKLDEDVYYGTIDVR